MEISILFEDDTCIAIDKPAGIVVNRASTVHEKTIQDWAQESIKFPANTNHGRNKLKDECGADNEFYERSGIVHRIDKETSGILLIAKTPYIFHELQRQFKERRIKKTYLAVAHGAVVPAEGKISAPIARLPWNRERFGIVPGGKDAVTTYKVLRVFNSGNQLDSRNVFSLVELYPETGRTHQLRVHLKYIGHPILGDCVYAGRVVSRNDRKRVTRVMLHAWKLTFIHPESGKNIAIVAPIPDDIRMILLK